MVDDPYRLLLQHEAIDLKKAREVEMWTDILGIYTADLVHAVAIVGTSSTAVLQFIIDRGIVGRALRNHDSKRKPPSGGAGNGGGASTA